MESSMCEFISNLNLAWIIGMVFILLGIGIAIGISLVNESHAEINRQKNKNIRKLFYHVTEYYVMPSDIEDIEKRLDDVLKS